MRMFKLLIGTIYLKLLLIPTCLLGQDFQIINGKPLKGDAFKIKKNSSYIKINNPSDLVIRTQDRINLFLEKNGEVIKSTSFMPQDRYVELDYSFDEGEYDIIFRNNDINKSYDVYAKGTLKVLGIKWWKYPTAALLGVLISKILSNGEKTNPPLPEPPLPGGG